MDKCICGETPKVMDDPMCGVQVYCDECKIHGPMHSKPGSAIHAWDEMMRAMRALRDVPLYSVAQPGPFSCPFAGEKDAAVIAEMQRWYKTPCEFECMNGDGPPRNVLVDALRWIVNVCCDVGKAGGQPEDGEHDAALQAGMNALKAEDSRANKP